MIITKKDLEPFSKLISSIMEQANDITVLNATLESLTLEELERTRAYFSGTGKRTSFQQLRTIVIGSFIAGMMIFLLNMFKNHFFVAVIAVAFLLICVIELVRPVLTSPVRPNLAVAIARGKYDRVVNLIDIILAERYAEVRKK
ncbi:hypothetical protein PWEIH_12225 [Listeria weihenstephanensis FSL R9-0317]|uniref:Uncharacterized protein n=1 Tax=Listeria weihenstephanensis TaxID=1006155 RepID=A0A1S7FUR8_9LIST|nr:hypothetical protein [Listeria weihenstephanensis]AQY51153.1 hypothetical protein UE46_08895 [Listeria weihenstephanensis]EUJ36918.1 hypothetical protein PWEIH_12225 [Listeria weihenstephanensis FSL R9-0317]